MEQNQPDPPPRFTVMSKDQRLTDHHGDGAEPTVQHLWSKVTVSISYWLDRSDLFLKSSLLQNHFRDNPKVPEELKKRVDQWQSGTITEAALWVAIYAILIRTQSLSLLDDFKGVYPCTWASEVLSAFDQETKENSSHVKPTHSVLNRPTWKTPAQLEKEAVEKNETSRLGKLPNFPISNVRGSSKERPLNPSTVERTPQNATEPVRPFAEIEWLVDEDAVRLRYLEFLAAEALTLMHKE